MGNTVINTPELLNLDSTTGATVLAKGTVADRPETPTFSVDYLVVAGGGGGIYSTSPGGGAGGLRTSYGSTSGGGASAENSITVTSGNSFAVTVGTGGPHINASNYNSPTKGGNSTFGTITSLAGGIGVPGNDSNGFPWKNGGSGVGGVYSGNSGGQGTAGQGFAGGSINGAPNYKAGGSGGAGGVGLDGTGSDYSGSSGAGGPGLAVNILNATNAATASVGQVSGSDVYYAGGGGGGSDAYRSRPAGAGGIGGGGAGGYNSNGTSATANTGGGGGAGSNRPSSMNGGDGGSGVVILRYPNSVSATVNGATQASGSPFTEGNDKITVLTSGTGTITFTDSTPTNPDEYPINGTLRFNTETNKTEYFDGTGWYEIVDEYASGFIGPATNYFDTKLYTGNGATQSIGGYINGSGSFNGSSSKIDLGNNSSNNSSVISVSLWFKTAGHSGAATLINNGGANGGETGYFLGLNSNGTIKFEAGTGTVNGAVNYADSQWHQIVLTLNSGAYNIYVDGNTTPVITGSGAFTTTATRPTWIGQFSYDPSAIEFFNGSIDQVRLYNVALSSSDVAALNLETAATATTAAFPSGQTATATYTMDTSANGLLTTTDLSTVDYPAGTGCMALYEMNGNSNDTSNTYNGTPTNITYKGGAFDQAAVFNGSTSFIDTNINSSIGNSYSISLWFNSNSNSSTWKQLTGLDNNTYNYTTFISRQANGTLNFIGSDDSSNVTATGTTVTSINQWYHVVAVKDGTTTKLYLDGQEEATGSANATTSWLGSLILGKYFGTTNQSFDGLIDQVRIFSTALTQSQVTTLARGIGTSYSGAATNVNFNGHLDFAPDLVWLKCRNVAKDHRLYDSVRGATKFLESNNAGVEATASTSLTSFDSNGFTLGAASTTNSNNDTFVSWSWKAGGTAVTNNDGTVASQVSANRDSGFSIVTNTSPAGSYTWGHGLDKTPELWIHKSTDYAYGWETLYPDTFGTNNTDLIPADWNYLRLDTTAAASSSGYSANNTVLSSTGWGQVNNFVTYCWHSVAGYSKIGTYTGDGTTSGKIITTGFEPSFLLTKPVGSSGGYWYILDNKRSTTNPRNDALFPNDALAEISSTNYNVDFLSTGFELKNNTIGFNQNNEDYIYMAFA